MSFQRVQEIKRTKKNHMCFGCASNIAEGSRAFYQVGVFEGDFHFIYLCVPCNEFLSSKEGYELAEEGFYLGEIGEARMPDVHR